mgnify:CR=1 FL=1
MISVTAFADEFVKIAQTRSALKDFVGGIDPTGGATFQYGMTDYEKPQVANPGLARAAGPAGGVVGGALVIPSAISGLIGGVKGLGGGGSMGARLARAGRGIVSGAKEPVVGVANAIRSRSALKQMQASGAASLSPGQLRALRDVAARSPIGQMVGPERVGKLSEGHLRMLLKRVSPAQAEMAQKQVGSALSSGLATLGTSGVIGGGSAYLQYGKGQQAAEKYLG